METSLEELLRLAQLTEEERLVYTRLSSTKRQKQWLATRALVNAYFGRKVVICYKDTQQPFLANAQQAISISHSEALVAVQFSLHGKVGIDIQKTTKTTLLKAADYFLTQDEVTFLTSNEQYDITILYTIWSLKEAAFKFIGNPTLTLKNNFILHSLTTDPIKPTTGNATIQYQSTSENEPVDITLAYEHQDHFVLAYVI